MGIPFWKFGSQPRNRFKGLESKKEEKHNYIGDWKIYVYIIYYILYIIYYILYICDYDYVCVRIEQSVDEFGLRSLYNVNEDIHQRLNRVLVCLGFF